MKLLPLIRFTALALAVASAAPAWADVSMDTGSDDEWAKPKPKRDDKGKVTVQGDDPEANVPPPPVPYPVSVGIGLAADVGGFVLLIPELSTNHVLGWRTNANRLVGYLGLGTLALSSGLALGLSGSTIGAVIVAPIIEAALIGAGFGMALLANLALHASFGSSTVATVGNIGVNDLVGIPLVVLAIPFIAAAALFPIFCALVPGNELSGQDERELAPIDSVGFLPLRGGGMVSVGLSF